MLPPPGAWMMPGPLRGIGDAYTSCRMGKMLESYLNPSSHSTSSAHSDRFVIEYVDAR